MKWTKDNIKRKIPLFRKLELLGVKYRKTKRVVLMLLFWFGYFKINVLFPDHQMAFLGIFIVVNTYILNHINNG
jgi:hypothetical protein